MHADMVSGRFEPGGHVDEGLGRVTKGLGLYQQRKTWIIRFDKDFVSARKQQKLRREKLQEHVNTEPDFRDDLDAYEASWYGLNTSYEGRII